MTRGWIAAGRAGLCRLSFRVSAHPTRPVSYYALFKLPNERAILVVAAGLPDGKVVGLPRALGALSLLSGGVLWEHGPW